MRQQRVRNILAAGALTGLVLLTLVAFGWQSLAARDAARVQPAADGTSGDASLQAENEQLRQAVQTLQQREAVYQSQIEAANQTILQLESEGVSRAYYEDDDDWYEDDHEEDEEHEYGEHEREHDDD